MFCMFYYFNIYFCCSVVCETGPSSLYRSGEIEIDIGGGKRGVSTKAVRFTYRVSYEPTLPSMHCTHSLEAIEETINQLEVHFSNRAY